jgi:predicted metal-binding membrane protein
VSWTLSGSALVTAWAFEALALSRLAVTGRDGVARFGAVGFLALAATHALVIEAPPMALVDGARSLGAAAIALGAIVITVSLAAVESDRDDRPWLVGGAAAALLYLGSLAIITVFQPAAGVAPDLLELSVRQQGQVLLSACWSLVGVISLIAGLRRNRAPVRNAALGLLLLTVAKVFLYDLSALTSLYRVVSFIALGLLLLVGAFAPAPAPAAALGYAQRSPQPAVNAPGTARHGTGDSDRHLDQVLLLCKDRGGFSLTWAPALPGSAPTGRYRDEYAGLRQSAGGRRALMPGSSATLTTVATRDAGVALRLPSLRPRWRPTVPFELLIAGAWIVVLWWSVAGTGSSGPAGSRAARGMGQMPGMAQMPGMGRMPSMPGMNPTMHLSAVLGLPMWVVMAVAMMLPGALPALSHVSTHSVRRRRGRAMTLFAIVYVGVWMIFGAVALVGAGALHASAGVELGLALTVAVGWQLTGYKRRALRDCHRGVPLPPRGWAANAGVARFGLVNAGACVRACWPAMLAMVFVPGSQMWIWMPALTGLMWAEKLASRPRWATRMVAAALTVAAVAAVALL